MSEEYTHLLIQKFFDQSLEEGEKDQLEALLLSSPKARSAFREIGRIHGLLNVSKDLEQGRNAAGSDVVVPFLPSNQTNPNTSRRWAMIALSTAACIGILASVLHFQNPGPPLVAPSLATITSTQTLEWTDGSKVPRGTSIDAGLYDLQFGTLRFEMGAGAAVCVSAPCKFEILSNKEIRVDHGKLTARLPNKEDELIVTMPGLKLTDLGTGFGVDVAEDGETLVSVFEGRVQLDEEEGSAPTILGAGRSIRHTSTTGSSLQPLKFDPTPFRDLWPLTLGIDDASDLVKFVPPGPADRTLFALQARNHVFLLPEQQSIALEEALLTDLSAADSTWPNSSEHSSIPNGSRISSYLAIYNPPKGNKVPVRNLNGSITFNREILGVICTAEPLSLSDKIVGIDMREHNLSANRELESHDGGEGGLPHDTVTLSADRRSIHFNFSARQGIDNMRIILRD